MKGPVPAALLLLAVLLASSPAAALHPTYLDIAVGRGGNATVTFEYSLPPVEQFLAWVGAVRPDRDLELIFNATTGGGVETLSAGDGVTLFSVEDFAAVSGDEAGTTYRTPDLNLSWAREGYENSVLAPLLDPDFSPDMTVIRFPDGYSVTYHGELLIPATVHSY